jgi:hypothetical protein
MKRIRIALLACLAGLLAVACEKENETPLQDYSTNIFKVDVASFVDNNNNKVWLQYGDPSKLLYEEGDKIKITSNHGVSRDYVLRYRTTSDGQSPAVTENGWYAQSDDTLGGSVFYAAFVDGYNVNSAVLTGNGPSYTFNLNNFIGNHPERNKVILTGSTETNEGQTAITLQPACAILRLKTNGASMEYVKVGFQANKIPVIGTLNASTVSISATHYLSGVTSGGAGSFLYMRPCDNSEGENQYWYVAIPISGTDVSTTLYLEWKHGTTTTQYKTSGEVTLEPGRVYTVGTERSVPFTAKGYTKSYFATAAGGAHAIAFSAGNLQGRTRFIPGTGEVDDWQLAPAQFKTLDNANLATGLRRNVFLDLFGYGTSGNTAHPNLASDSTGKYPSGTIDNTDNEWGHKNYAVPGIVFGSTTVTNVPWVTLTKDEWTYIVNRTGKVGLATITIDGKAHQGLILLPDYDEYSGEWSMPEGVSFNASVSSYTANSFPENEWAILENNGAVFLPVTAYRSGTSLSAGNMGYYWTSTGGAGGPQNNSYVLKISEGNVSVISKARSHGCAVRLAYRVW